MAWRVVTQLYDSEPKFNPNLEIVVHVAADSLLQFEEEDGMECTVHVEKDVAESEITAVQAYPPVWPPRFVIATISSESETTVSIVFSGSMLPFADGFDAAGIGKKKVRGEEANFAEWFRVCRGVDITDTTKKTGFLKCLVTWC